MTRSVLSLLCALLLCASSLAFEFEDCGSEIGSFGEIQIGDCKTSDPKCILPREVPLKGSITFTPNQDVSQVEIRAFGIVLDVTVPFPMEETKLCDKALKCPLKKGETYKYENTVTLEKKTPPLSVDIMWQLVNEKEEKVVCFKFPVKVK